KHDLQVEGRSADDLEHVGGRGLLLQRFAQFVEQPRVLDRDDGLLCEIAYKLYLLVGERPNLLAVDRDGADQLAFLQHRNGEERAGTCKVDEGHAGRIGVVSWLGLGIGDLNRLLRRRHPSEPGPRIGAKHRVALPLLGESRWGIMQRDGPKRAALEEKHVTEFGVTSSCRVLSIFWNTISRSPGELEMTCSTSDVAVCC